MATRLNISVPDDLAEEIKKYGIRTSEVCQKALREAVEDRKPSMTREEFKEWLEGLISTEQTAVRLALSEALYEDHCDDGESMAAIRRHVYDIYQDWH